MDVKVKSTFIDGYGTVLFADIVSFTTFSQVRPFRDSKPLAAAFFVCGDSGITMLTYVDAESDAACHYAEFHVHEV